MTALAERIYDEALELPVEERLGLLDKLLESVSPTEPSVQEAWLKESEVRYEAYSRGEVEAIDAEEVLAKIQERLTK